MALTIIPIRETKGITAGDICGLWEVIRIYKEDGQSVSYPWIKDRFKFNFLPEMIFLRLKDGYNSHGTWKLVEKTHGSGGRYSIVLDESTEYTIETFNPDDMILLDQGFSYFLVRRL